MQLPLELPRHGIPASEPGRLRRLAKRTTIVRAALALALCAALALAFLVARKQDVRQAPLVPEGTTGMLVLDLSASVYEGALDVTIEKLVGTDERTGLVVFSDSAYELLPPGAPSRELQSLLRFFKARPDATLPPNPWEEFRGGTRISEGMDFARGSLLRENVTNGSIVLVSDLEILPDEIARLSEVLAQIRQDGFQIRIVPLFPSEEKRALIEQLVGSDAFLSEPEQEGVRAPEEQRIASVAPWLFVLAGGLLILLLAANERVLSRLEVRR
ncbi:MAG: vWA domain-containing protein [Gaiellaceae bacterium]